MRKLNLAIVVAAASSFLATSLGGQESLVQPSPEGAFIAPLFKERLGEAPRMAWVVTPDMVIAEEKHPAIYLYWKRQTVERAEYLGPVGKEELVQLRRQHNVACDPLDQTDYRPYFKYRLPGLATYHALQVFYTSALPQRMVPGYRTTQLSPEALAATLARLNPSAPERLHTHFALAPNSSLYTYSFHDFFGPQTKELVGEAIVLHLPDGQPFAWKWWDVNEETLCDGCGRPIYDPAPEKSSFGVINTFVVEMFPFPLLLLDSSTVEGRALSFTTFTMEGTYDEYRLYEYVVNCIL